MTSIPQEGKQKIMSISTQGIILIIIAATLMSAGSLGLRGAIDAIGGFGDNIATIHKDIFALMLNPIFIIGITLYGAGTLLWMRVISTEPLSVGYPILMSVAFIAIAFGAAIFFKEAITPQKLIGMVVIVVGVVIATSG
jgi:multidrug transporter EmrE-like cation transporter